jgi:Rap1a immunity proteins
MPSLKIIVSRCWAFTAPEIATKQRKTVRRDNFNRISSSGDSQWRQMKLRIVLLAALWAPADAPARAEVRSALDVYQACKSAVDAHKLPNGDVILATPNTAFCWGAFTVLRGVTGILTDDGASMALHVCAPNESTVTQYISIFLKYVDDHPELAHNDFDFVALDTLVKVFPCRNRASVR